MFQRDAVRVIWLPAIGLLAALAMQEQAAADAPFVLSSADTMEKVFRDEPWTRPSAA